MIKNYFLLVLLLFSSICVSAQTSIDFDSFSLGDVSPQSSEIVLWPASSATDGQVSNTYSYSSPNSLLIRQQTGTISDDILINLGNKSSGVWVIDWMMYVPTGQSAYFNIQENANINPTSQWNGEFFVGSTASGGTTGLVSHNILTSTASFPYDTWFEVEITIDLNVQEISVTIDGNTMFADQTYEDNNGTSGTQIGAINLYSPGANTMFYLDDFEFEEICVEPSITGVNAPTEVCSGETVMMAAASDAEEVRWFDQATGGIELGTGLSFESDPIYAETTFWVEAKNSMSTGAECTSQRIEIIVDVIEVAMPTGASTQQFSSNDQLSDLSVTGVDLTWYSDQNLTNEIPIYTYLVDGTTYYVTDTDATNGCESEALAITVEETLSTENLALRELVFYPNPVKDILNISNDDQKDLSIKIYDLKGQVVFERDLSGNESKIFLTDLNSGIYFINFSSNKTQKTYKLIKQ